MRRPSGWWPSALATGGLALGTIPSGGAAGPCERTDLTECVRSHARTSGAVEAAQAQADDDRGFSALIAAGEHLESAMGDFVAGDENAFRPWIVEASDPDEITSAARQAGAASYWIFPFELELIFAKQGQDLYYLRTALLVYEGEIGLTSFSGRHLSRPFSLDRAPLGAYIGGGRPFRAAGLALANAVTDGGCDALPTPSPAMSRRFVEAANLDGFGRIAAQRWVDNLRLDLSAVQRTCATIAALEPDEIFLRLDDLSYIAVDASRERAGVIRATISPGTGGRMRIRLGSWRVE